MCTFPEVLLLWSSLLGSLLDTPHLWYQSVYRLQGHPNTPLLTAGPSGKLVCCTSCWRNAGLDSYFQLFLVIFVTCCVIRLFVCFMHEKCVCFMHESTLWIKNFVSVGVSFSNKFMSWLEIHKLTFWHFLDK